MTERHESDRDAALRETLASLELPPDAVGSWLAHVRAFCDAHGGRRIYGELLILLDRCESANGEGQEQHEDEEKKR